MQHQFLYTKIVITDEAVLLYTLLLDYIHKFYRSTK